MVKVIIQVDGKPDKVISGEFANVMVATDVGDEYKVCNGIAGEIDPDEVPGGSYTGNSCNNEAGI